MERMEYEIRDKESVVGRACAERQGLYWRIEAEAVLETDRIVRLYAHNGGENMRIGVLLPESGVLRLRRRIPASAFAFAPHTYMTTSPDAEWEAQPELSDKAGETEAEAYGGEEWEPFAGTVLGCPAEGMQRSRENGTELAIPYEPGKEFPLMPLFCFCALRQVQGRLCWVLLLDADGKPIHAAQKKPLTSAENVLK